MKGYEAMSTTRSDTAMSPNPTFLSPQDPFTMNGMLGLVEQPAVTPRFREVSQPNLSSPALGETAAEFDENADQEMFSWLDDLESFERLSDSSAEEPLDPTVLGLTETIPLATDQREDHFNLQFQTLQGRPGLQTDGRISALEATVVVASLTLVTDHLEPSIPGVLCITRAPTFETRSTDRAESRNDSVLSGHNSLYGTETRHENANFLPYSNPNEAEAPIKPERFAPTILDFSPELDSSGGGTKLIVCLSEKLAERENRNGLQIFFGWVGVAAVALTPTTLRCFTPALPPGRYSLSVANQKGRVLAQPSPSQFEYRPALTTTTPMASMNHLSRSATFSLLHNVSSRNERRRTIRRDNSKSNISSDAGITAVEHGNKVRVVERLIEHTRVSPSLNNNPMLPNVVPERALTADDHVVGEGEDWLEDSALSVLRPSDLASIMDHVLLKVVKQLIQFASSDQELRTELDSLDECGFSLLHYCSMFNLELLVPVIISKGGSVHRKTGSGMTALHLAAGSGHMAMTQLLIQNGANPNDVDSDRLTAFDKAIESMESRPASTSDVAPGSESASPPRAFSREDRSWRSLSRSPFSNGANSTPARSTPGLSRSTSPNNLSDYSHPEDAKTASPLTSSAAERDFRQSSLLYDAFSSLSLADKCAFSLSLHSGVTDKESLMSLKSVDGASDDEFDVQSVLSETDKESLGVAMSMMTPTELSRVEAEVRVIQNNVRAWLLRKNYTNLREAARVLQTHWRQRRAGVGRDLVAPATDQGSLTEERKQVTAAAKMQAATRGMLARKSFASLKRQAMASLVIQKSLVTWWHQKSHDDVVHGLHPQRGSNSTSPVSNIFATDEHHYFGAQVNRDSIAMDEL